MGVWGFLTGVLLYILGRVRESNGELRLLNLQWLVGLEEALGWTSLESSEDRPRESSESRGLDRGTL
ncbi:hypothetical protein EV1_046236 [Malus domestica]